MTDTKKKYFWIDRAKTITEVSIKNNKAMSHLNKKLSELKNDKGMIAPYLTASLFNHFKFENTSHFNLIKDNNSIRMNDFLIDGGLPVSLYCSILTFRDSIKPFKLVGDPLETMTNYDFNVSQSNPQVQKLIYEFGKEMNFNNKQKARKSNRGQSFLKLLKSHAIMFSGN